jgi:hypothetical protein
VFSSTASALTKKAPSVESKATSTFLTLGGVFATTGDVLDGKTGTAQAVIKAVKKTATIDDASLFFRCNEQVCIPQLFASLARGVKF